MPFRSELTSNSVTVFPALVQAWLWHQAGLPAVVMFAAPTLWRVMPRRQGPAWPAPHPFPAITAIPLHSPGSPGDTSPKGIPVQRWVQTPHVRGTRLPKPPSHGQGSKGRLCPALPRQFPSQAGGHGITAWPGGVWLWESCLETSSLGAKKEQAHPSVLIKTTVRLPHLALGFGQGFTSGIPSRQTYVPNSGAGKGKRVFTQH